MNRYIQITISTTDENESDILIAKMSQSGFEGFEEEPGKLHAFIPETLYDDIKVEKIIAEIKGVADPFHTLFQKEFIEPRNWNEEWEKDFDPVVVGQFCAVRAHFHKEIPGVLHNIIITPKMSFGTGHHATTYMMIACLEHLDLKSKTVFDFGTGTGVLAILCCKMGAASVLAIDSDEWSIENAMENAEVNGCQHIQIKHTNSLAETGRFDVILANINLQVLLENLDSVRQHLNQTGVLIGSGVLQSDTDNLKERAVRAGFAFEVQMIRDNWMSFSLKNREN